MKPSFSTRLQVEMRREKVTINELSIRSGITRAYIYRVLKDEQNPSIAIASKLAESIGLRLTLAPKV